MLRFSEMSQAKTVHRINTANLMSYVLAARWEDLQCQVTGMSDN